MEHSRLVAVRGHCLLYGSHMRKPGVDNLHLAGFSQCVSREARPVPLPLCEVTAADQEDQRLTPSFRNTRKVVIQISHGLEANIELKPGGVAPSWLGTRDVSGSDDWPSII